MHQEQLFPPSFSESHHPQPHSPRSMPLQYLHPPTHYSSFDRDLPKHLHKNQPVIQAPLTICLRLFHSSAISALPLLPLCPEDPEHDDQLHAPTHKPAQNHHPSPRNDFAAHS